MKSEFIVTEKAKVPVSVDETCFRCGQPIGGYHLTDCVLLAKMVKVRMTIEYWIQVPAHWKKEDVEFNRNDGTNCADNAIKELEEISKKDGCLCGRMNFECIQMREDSFLNEHGKYKVE